MCKNEKFLFQFMLCKIKHNEICINYIFSFHIGCCSSGCCLKIWIKNCILEWKASKQLCCVMYALVLFSIFYFLSIPFFLFLPCHWLSLNTTKIYKFMKIHFEKICYKIYKFYGFAIIYNLWSEKKYLKVMVC